MSGETQSTPSGLTTDTLHLLLNRFREDLYRLLEEKDVRYQQRYEAQQQGIRDALASAERASAKADAATEKRFDGVNEFRDQLRDQAATFMSRAESLALHDGTRDKIDTLEALIAKHDTALSKLGGHSAGLKDGWGYVVGAVGIAAAIITMILAFNR